MHLSNDISERPPKDLTAEENAKPPKDLTAEENAQQGAQRDGGAEGKELTSAQYEPPTLKSLPRAEKLVLGQSESMGYKEG